MIQNQEQYLQQYKLNNFNIEKKTDKGDKLLIKFYITV